MHDFLGVLEMPLMLLYPPKAWCLGRSNAFTPVRCRRIDCLILKARMKVVCCQVPVEAGFAEAALLVSSYGQIMPGLRLVASPTKNREPAYGTCGSRLLLGDDPCMHSFFRRLAVNAF